MVAGFFGPVCQVVGIDADAMAADQAGRERQKIPFGLRGVEDVHRVDVEQMANRRELVHQGDVEISLRVFDHLRRLGDLDRGCFVDSGGYHRSIDLGHDVECSSFCAETTFLIVSKR